MVTCVTEGSTDGQKTPLSVYTSQFASGGYKIEDRMTPLYNRKRKKIAVVKKKPSDLLHICKKSIENLILMEFVLFLQLKSLFIQDSTLAPFGTDILCKCSMWAHSIP